VDGLEVSRISLADLDLIGRRSITVRIGVKDDARFVGGLNLFGRAFGNYPQDILLRLRRRG
jgi:predicted transcriptional regulator